MARNPTKRPNQPGSVGLGFSRPRGPSRAFGAPRAAHTVIAANPATSASIPSSATMTHPSCGCCPNACRRRSICCARWGSMESVSSAACSRANRRLECERSTASVDGTSEIRWLASGLRHTVHPVFTAHSVAVWITSVAAPRAAALQLSTPAPGGPNSKTRFFTPALSPNALASSRTPSPCKPTGVRTHTPQGPPSERNMLILLDMQGR